MPAPFLDIRFPDDIAYGSEFGPRWNTDVIRTGSGYEQRTQNWSHPLYAGDVMYGVTTEEKLSALLAFFHEVRGRTYAFRFRDWGDYQASAAPLVPDGGPTLQLRKVYGTGANDYVREIRKPLGATVTLTRAAAAFTAYTLDDTTGVITLDPDATADIDSIAQDGAGTVTATAHGYSTGDWIYISGVQGMTDVNGQAYPITVIDPDTFELGTSTTGMDAYTGGGTAAYYVQPDEPLTWSGEFDVPCRFDTDRVSRVFEHYKLQSTQVPVAEVRVR